MGTGSEGQNSGDGVGMGKEFVGSGWGWGRMGMGTNSCPHAALYTTLSLLSSFVPPSFSLLMLITIIRPILILITIVMIITVSEEFKRNSTQMLHVGGDNGITMVSSRFQLGAYKLHVNCYNANKNQLTVDISVTLDL